MKKRVPLFLLLLFFLLSCKPRTPSQLAQDACDCYTEVKAIKNTTKQLRKMDDCFRLLQNNLQELEEEGSNNDWTPEQVEKARVEFDRVYDKCTGGEHESSKTGSTD